MLAVNDIYNMDCIDGMRQLPDQSVDLVITDPPFAIEFGAKRRSYNRKDSNVMDGYVELPKHEYAAFTMAWMAEAYRTLKASGSMCIFSGWNNLKDILNTIDDLNLITVNHIIWKYQFGVVTTRRFVSSHYHCLYVCKDDKLRQFYPYSRHGKTDKDLAGRSLHYQDKEDVWNIPREYWTNKQKTPTKLPSEIIRKLLLYCSKPNDIVLDPFLGSGQVAVVSKDLGRQFVGFELVKDYYKFARGRLNTVSLI